ncbi:MAG: hypothetical protein AAF433_03315 [Bacteroidota bacterium]
MALRFLHITLAFSLLFSQAGLPLWQHYCEGELKGTSWLSPAESCHNSAKEEKSSCHLTCPMHAALIDGEVSGPILKADCCSDELDLSKLAQLQQVVDLPDWELTVPVAVKPAEVQAYHLPPRGEQMLLAQQVRPPPLIKSGRELRIRLSSYLC